MVSTKLIIQGVDIALAENIPVSIDFVLSDVRVPDKRNASFSKTINIYATNEINKIFENIFEVNIKTQYFNKNKKTPCSYYVNELLNFTGSLQLIKIVLKPDGNIIYECSIIGEGGSLFLDIGDKYITGNADSSNDLDFSAYNHTYDRATQISLNNANVGTGLGVLYPFVDRGTNGGSDDTFDVEDFIPCLSFWEYWNKIFEMAGYTYSSSIIDSAEFKKYIMLPNIINVPLDSSQINNSQFYLGANTGTGGFVPINIQSATKYIVPLDGYITQPPFFDLGSQYNNTNYIVTLNNNGRYNIAAVHDLTFNFTHTNPVVAYAKFVDLKIKSMTEFSTDGGTTWNELCAVIYEWGNGGVQDTRFNSNFIQSYASGEVSLAAGTKLRHTIELNQMPLVLYYDSLGHNIMVGTGTWDVYWTGYNAGSPPTLGTQFYGLLTSKNITTGQTMLINHALPVKIKQRDFVKSVIQALNLQIEPDKTNPKHLYIESYSDFYNGDIINLENRTDLDKDQSINPNLLEGKRYIWRYKSDSDYYNDLYQKTYQEPFGTEIINVDNDFLKDDKVNEIIFSPTPNVANYYMGVAIPRIYSFENNTYKPIAQNIRWLYCGGYKTAPGSFTYTDSFDTDLVTNQYLYAGHTDDPFNPTLDLNFGVPKAVYYTYVNAYYTNNNFYNRFHKIPTENITSKDSKFVTKYLWLTSKDINKFSFRQRWFIDNAYYIVNKISNYDPTKSDSILCELIKLLESNVFSPSQVLIATEPNITAGATITRQVNNTSLSRGINNQVFGSNCIAIGNNIIIPASCSNVTVIGNDIVVAENTQNSSIINTNNSALSRSNYSVNNNSSLLMALTGDATTTNNTASQIVFNTNTGEFTLDNYSVYKLYSKVLAVDILTGDYIEWEANGIATNFVGTVNYTDLMAVTSTLSTGSMSGCNLIISGMPVEQLNYSIAGLAATTIKWSCEIQYIKINM